MTGSLCISTGEKLKMHWSEIFQTVSAHPSLKSKFQTLNTNMNTHCTYKFISASDCVFLRNADLLILCTHKYRACCKNNRKHTTALCEKISKVLLVLDLYIYAYLLYRLYRVFVVD